MLYLSSSYCLNNSATFRSCGTRPFPLSHDKLLATPSLVVIAQHSHTTAPLRADRTRLAASCDPPTSDSTSFLLRHLLVRLGPPALATSSGDYVPRNAHTRAEPHHRASVLRNLRPRYALTSRPIDCRTIDRRSPPVSPTQQTNNRTFPTRTASRIVCVCMCLREATRVRLAAPLWLSHDNSRPASPTSYQAGHAQSQTQLAVVRADLRTFLALPTYLLFTLPSATLIST